MKIYHIAAISENNVIAKDDTIPWMVKGDLKRFKEITYGHPIIMGSKTFDSIGKKPLPGRTNVVLSRADEVSYDGHDVNYEEHGEEVNGARILRFEMKKGEVVYTQTIDEAIGFCRDKNEIYIIGGGEIYNQTLELADELRLTVVHEEIEEDDTCVYYPEITNDEWFAVWADSQETHSYVDYVRRPQEDR